jgi:hypothetical protein
MMFHKYREMHSPDTPGLYFECRRCGHIKDGIDQGIGPIFGG